MLNLPKNIIQLNEIEDIDQQETCEWLDALENILITHGLNRAHFLISKLIELIHRNGLCLPFTPITTPYINSIAIEQEFDIPGNLYIEQRIRSFTRWNALAMVLRASKHTNVGGHIASFASSATLYDVGFNYFWHSPSDKHGGDLIFFQGHSSPGIYSRSFLMGRLNETHLDNFRREVNGNGISSYPHPWLMPQFWQFPTVSMGLGPIMAIYQARFMKYIQLRGITITEERKVWAFVGDGETDEPETLGAINVAGREHLDNLIFVINCNLQRLDGPVRGNSKIIQELEALFRGAGWYVIKVIWGSKWDMLFARDKEGILINRMMEVVDGEYQNYRTKNGAFIRKHFFNTQKLKKLVEDLSDDDIWNLNRGGHDPKKIYTAFKSAINTIGKPTVILAKTIKGYGMGEFGQAMNITHQQKQLPIEALKKFRDQFNLPIKDEDIINIPYLKFAENSQELSYMRKCRNALGGYDLPSRYEKATSLKVPSLDKFISITKGSNNGHQMSTTMIFIRILMLLLKDDVLSNRIVPIVPDESRTFGMEGLFRQIGIWNQEGQKYIPEDINQLTFYREAKDGQILQEGINEAGGMCDWIAAATAYSTHGEQLIPFYIFYSMFGFQRVGDLAWAAGDMKSRGFLLGATSGKTTLNGEGLQHADGYSHIFASNIPNCISYDPTFGYELAVIIQDGLRRMVQQQENIYYYITLTNENYEHPALPIGSEIDIIKGMYAFKIHSQTMCSSTLCVQLLGSGAIFKEIIVASSILYNDWGIKANLWNCTSFTELARDGYNIERWNLLHPNEKPRTPYVTSKLNSMSGPVIAATDYVRAFAEQIRMFVPHQYIVLGTDGYGRSDTREALRNFFEVDRYWIIIVTLNALAKEKKIDHAFVSEAIKKYNIDCSKPNPITV